MVAWDKSGEVKIRDEAIPNSNITDLVSDAMRLRKDFNRTGLKQFFQPLSEMNVPKYVIINKQSWKQLEESPIQSRCSSGLAWLCWHQKRILVRGFCKQDGLACYHPLCIKGEEEQREDRGVKNG
jgi:hypothetical protein